ncbi:MAG: hypothetical protein LC777_00615 [Actinobacteria bacterium]|nr:hypothetical protein [Actinomycetota bacterium]
MEAVHVRVGLLESFDERCVFAFDLLEHEGRDVAPVDDPAVWDSGDRLAAVLLGG